MFIAVISLALPSMYQSLFAASGPIIPQQHINIGLAILLVSLYVLYLIFMIRTHPEEFASVAGGAAQAHDEPWSLGLSIAVVVAASVLAAFLSEILVGAVQGTGEALGLSGPFISLILLASVGGTPQAMSAIGGAQGPPRHHARHHVRELHPGALFVAPVVVFASYFVGPGPFLLSFSPAGIGLLFLAVLMGSIVATHGSANWYKGVQLIAVLMIALLL